MTSEKEEKITRISTASSYLLMNYVHFFVPRAGPSRAHTNCLRPKPQRRLVVALASESN